MVPSNQPLTLALKPPPVSKSPLVTVNAAEALGAARAASEVSNATTTSD
jgi:hypothetical protein